MNWKSIVGYGLLSMCILRGTAIAQTDRLCADQNGDGAVTPADFTAWIANFNQNNPVADVNQDGTVSPADFTAWIAAFNQGNAGPVCSVSLSSGLSVTGSISFIGDVDTYTINANAGDDLLFAIAETPTGSHWLHVRVYAPNGQLLNTTSFNSGFTIDLFDLPQSGTYTYVVRDSGDNNTGDYSLTAIVPGGAVDDDNVALSSGTTTTGSLALGDIDTFTINANAGDDLLFAIAETPGGSHWLHVRVYAPSGQLLNTTSFNSGFTIDLFDVVQSGTYTYVVRDSGANTIGDYSLTAIVPGGAVDADNVVLSSGATTTGSLDLGDIDTFTINANAGDDLLFAIAETPGGSHWLHVRVYAPNGQLLFTRSANSGFTIDLFDLPQSGTYTYVVRDDGANVTGNYSLTAIVPGGAVDDDNVALSSGTTTTGSLALGDIDTFTINANAGDDLLFAIAETPGGSHWLHVRVYAPNGQLLFTRSANSGFTIDLFDLPQSGTYTYVVRDDSATATGNYSLVATVVP